MRPNRRLDVLTLTAASAVAAAVAFAVNVLSARALGPSARGEVAFCLQLAYFLAPILCAAGDKVALRGARTGTGTLFRPSVAFLLTTGSVLAVVLSVVLRDARALSAPIAFVTAWFLMRRADTLAGSSMRKYLRPFIGYQVSIVVLSALLYFQEIESWWWWAAVYALPVVWLPFLPRVVPSSTLPWRMALKNARLVAASVAQMFTTRGQRLLLPIFSSSAELGMFAVVATATEPLFWAAQALADKRVGHQQQPRSFAECRAVVARDLMIWLPLSAALGLGLWVLIVPVFGPEYEPAKQLILPLTIASVTLALYRQAASWVLGGTKPANIGQLEMAAAGLSAVVYPAAIYVGAGLGAAWASVLVYALAGIYGTHLHMRRLRMDS
jgi:hypothetical protein